MPRKLSIFAALCVVVFTILGPAEKRALARVNGATTVTTVTAPDIQCFGGTNQGSGNPNTEDCLDWNGNWLPTGSSWVSPAQKVGDANHPFLDVEVKNINSSGGGQLVIGAGGLAGPAPAIQLLVAGSTITAACGGTTLIGATGAITLNAATPIAAPAGECHTLLVSGATGAATITFSGVSALPAATGAVEFLGATGTAAMPVGDIRSCAWNVSASGPYWSCR